MLCAEADRCLPDLSACLGGVRQVLLRHSAPAKRSAKGKESRMDEMVETGKTEPADLAERPGRPAETSPPTGLCHLLEPRHHRL